MITLCVVLAIMCAMFAMLWLTAEDGIDAYHQAIEQARKLGQSVPPVISTADAVNFPEER